MTTKKVFVRFPNNGGWDHASAKDMVARAIGGDYDEVYSRLTAQGGAYGEDVLVEITEGDIPAVKMELGPGIIVTR